MSESILVATDGSEDARNAVEAAVALASERKATVYVLAVVDRRTYGEPGLSTEELVTIEAEDRYRDALSEAERWATAARVNVECAIRHGVPHEDVVEYADAIDADVVVVGVHGDHDTHLGTVGRRVAAATDRDVRTVDGATGSEPESKSESKSKSKSESESKSKSEPESKSKSESET